MKNIFKYLKQSKVSVLIIFVLLAMQAYCDLSLPRYTSNMVNVGIQQAGIENSTPQYISESTLNNLLFFADQEEQKLIYDNYTKLEETTENIKKYPELKKQDIYILKNTTTNELNQFFEEALIIDSYLTSANFKQTIPASQENDIYATLKQLPKEELNKIQENINKQLKATEDSIITQGAINLVKKEYEKIGINTNEIQTNYIIKTGIVMLTIALISMVITIIVAFLAAKVSASLGKLLRDSVFKKVLSFSSHEFNKYSTASLITRSTNDITQVQMLTVMLLRVVFYAPIMAIGGIINVLNTNTQMTWIIAVAVAIIFFIVMTLFIITMPKFKIIQKLVDKVNLVSREILSGLSVVRAFSKEKHEEQRFDDANTKLMKTGLFVNRTMALMMPIMMLVMNLIIVAIVWFGAKHIDVGNMQVGDMMAFMQYTMEIVMSFLMISMVSIILPRAIVSLNRINEVISTETQITNIEKPKTLNETKKGIVEFKNVSFRYPDADNDIITNISFTAKPGETTAIIGSTGSGKSTIINLIPRFFDVTDGQILVNGTNIKEASIKELRSKIGFVAQKGILFSGTIRSNIAYGKNDISDEEIYKALEIAQAKEFVDKLENKLDSKIAQGGKNVSGGQKQRLSIARAIAINPDIFIFDDSFSALDFKTDANLRKSLKEITKDKTTIIVAQRINTIMNAEQIIVLDEGQIVGKGTHKELINNCNVYKQIALSQLSQKEVE